MHRTARLKDAEEVYGRILARDPRHAAALHLLGVIRQQQGRHEEALELIGRALEIDSKQAAFHNNYGAALLSLERFAEAEASFRRALALRPDYADALANLGMAQAALGNDSAADASLRRAIQYQPWHRDATMRLAKLLQRQGREDEAGHLLDSAIAAALPAIPVGNGVSGAAGGRVEEGAEYFRTAIMGSVKPRADAAAVASDRLAYDGSHVTPADLVNITAERDEYVCERASIRRPDPDPAPEGEGRTRVAFISPHCVLDSTNGAATATLDGLKLLAAIGFSCEVYCGTRVDAWDGARIEEVLQRRDQRYIARDARIGQFHAAPDLYCHLHSAGQHPGDDGGYGGGGTNANRPHPRPLSRKARGD